MSGGRCAPSSVDLLSGLSTTPWDLVHSRRAWSACRRPLSLRKPHRNRSGSSRWRLQPGLVDPQLRLDLRQRSRQILEALPSLLGNQWQFDEGNMRHHFRIEASDHQICQSHLAPPRLCLRLGTLDA